MLRLRTFGGLSLDGDEGPLSGAAGRRRSLALVALLAASGDRGISRAKLIGRLWPESDEEKARNVLAQTLHALRRELGVDDLVIGATELRLNPTAITSDLGEFEEALAGGDPERAVALYSGSFLDGFYLNGVPEFERWAEEERARLAHRAASAMEQVAQRAALRGDRDGAVVAWRQLATIRPLDSRVAVGLMTALAAAGDLPGAIVHARIHTAMVRQELDAAPDASIAALTDQLQREPALVHEQLATDDANVGAVESREDRTEAAAVERPKASLAGNGRMRRVAPLVAFACLVLASAGLAALWRSSRAPASGVSLPRVLVTEADNATADSVFDHSVTTALTEGVQESDRVTVLARTQIRSALQRMRRDPGTTRIDETIGRELAQREGVTRVIVPGVVAIGLSYRFTVRLIDPVSGNVVKVESATASDRAHVLDVLDDLARRVRRDLGGNVAAAPDVSLPLATTGSLDALKRFADGQRAFDGGHNDEAQHLWLEAVALDSDFALAHGALARLYYFTDDRAAGEAHFARAIRRADRLTERERLLIQANAEGWRGNRPQAIELRKGYLARYPGDLRVLADLAYDYLRSGRFDDAQREYERLVVLDSFAANPFINLATIHKARMTRGADPRVEGPRALELYRKAFAREPDYVTSENINAEFGGVFVAMQQFDSADAVFRLMLDGTSHQRQLGQRSRALMEMVRGHYHGALSLLDEAAISGQAKGAALDEARARLIAAFALRDLASRAAMRQQMARVFTLTIRNRWDPIFLAWVGKTLAREGDVARARQLLDSLRAQSHRDSKTDLASAQLLAGEIALAGGRAAEAEGMLDIAFRMDSTLDARESLAFAAARAGHLNRAETLYATLARGQHFGYEPQEYWLMAPYWLGRIREQRGAIPAAIESYASFVDRWRDGDAGLLALRDARSRIEAVRQ